MIAYVFPGQGAQFTGMGKDLYEAHDHIRDLFEEANEILGFRISDIMFEGSAEDIKQTKVTQPALYLHSIAKAKIAGESFKPDVVGGHSLGEFSALAANGTLSWIDGLKLVSKRAEAMQRACDTNPGTMSAIIGLENEVVEKICNEIDKVVVPANYNCPKQLVISGTLEGIELANKALTEAGARRALVLPVGGAFHSPLMEPAKEELKSAIMETRFNTPACPIYQNVNGQKESDPDKIKQNLIDQLTASVKWTQTIQNMLSDGVVKFIEVGGKGKILSGLIKKVDRSIPTESL